MSTKIIYDWSDLSEYINDDPKDNDLDYLGLTTQDDEELSELSLDLEEV